MLEMIYPISGDYRPVLLVLEWCFASICAEMGIMFCIKYFKIRAKRNVQDLGFSALCFGLSIAWFFQIWSDYYISGVEILNLGDWNWASFRTFIWNVGFIGVLAGGFLFIILIERHLIFLRKYLATTIYVICNGIFITLFLWDVIIARMFAFVISFVILGFLFVFIWDLAKKVRHKLGFKNLAFKFLGSVAAFGAGVFFTVDFGIVALGLEWRLLGICILLGSFLSLCIFLLLFPPVALLEWKQSLEQIFLISKAGMCLIQKSYGTRARELDESIVTSALTTANMLIQEMVANGEQGFSKVKKENKMIFIFSSTLVNAAAISNEDNPAIPPKLKQLVLQFEEIYGDIVVHWNGDGSVFRPVETIIEEIFSD